MGCGPSKWRDPGVHQRSLSSVGDVVVFLPGLRVPRNIDFSRTLGDHLDKSVVERLTALRERVVVMATQESATALKPRRRVATWHGESGRCSIWNLSSLFLLNVNTRIFCFDSSLWFSGGSSTANLLQALEEYLPALIGLAKEGDYLSHQYS